MTSLLLDQTRCMMKSREQTAVAAKLDASWTQDPSHYAHVETDLGWLRGLVCLKNVFCLYIGFPAVFMGTGLAEYCAWMERRAA